MRDGDSSPGNAKVRTQYLSACTTACVGEDVSTGFGSVRIPGSIGERFSTLLGNQRIHRLMRPFLSPGAVIVDVGAHIGFNAIFAAHTVGTSGHVIAVEPADDNVAVLRENVHRNGLSNVSIVPSAAGGTGGTRAFFVRGACSAVNSFFEESVYASVSEVREVRVVPVDDIVSGSADLIKIDVEGAELDVLDGMTRLLQVPHVRLVVEWHPLLQEKAGHAPGALPRALLDRGFSLTGAFHSHVVPVATSDVDGLVERLRRSGRPIDILAQRASTRVDRSQMVS